VVAAGHCRTDSALNALGQGDNPTALKLFREAANAGDLHAQVMLAQLLLNGNTGLTRSVGLLAPRGSLGELRGPASGSLLCPEDGLTSPALRVLAW
jgi:hypothetical protein